LCLRRQVFADGSPVLRRAEPGWHYHLEDERNNLSRPAWRRGRLGGLGSVASASMSRFFLPRRSAYLYWVVAVFIELLEALIVPGTGFL